jgi:AbiU2
LDEWTVYKQLYGSDQERIDLFNEVARHFFGLLQYTLRDSIVAQICRLTEKPKVMGYETLVIRRLCGLARQTHPDVADELEKDADAINDLCKPIREWRDNMVSHLNLAAHLDDASKPGGFSRKTVQDAVDAITTFLNKARLKLTNGEFHYDSVYRRDGVRPLLNALIEASQYRTLAEDDQVKLYMALREGKWGSLFTKLEDGGEKSH